MAQKAESTIYIIGAGVSGLAAAITLNKAGYKPIILDGNEHVGGRVHTYRQGNHILDKGFQVMLDEYPGVEEFLDLAALDLIKFSPGSIIFRDGKSSKLGDASRDLSFLLPTILSGVGSVGDKLKVSTLSRKLKNKSLNDIFETPEKTTHEYLLDYGFSTKIIENFFKPFYAGIYLEPDLRTSSRMFEFVFKMFATGNATIPRRGIAAIPQQMAAKLDQDQIRLNTPVAEVRGNTIILENGQNLTADCTIIAAPAAGLVSNLPDDGLEWKSVTNLYFETTHEGFGQPIIGLIADSDALVNNIHFLQDVFENHPKVVSASVVKSHDLSESALIDRVKLDLRDKAGIETGKLIKRVDIPQALPDLNNLNYALNSTETQLTENIFLAGDQHSNASLNAAMLNGKAAAQAVIDKIEDRVVVG
jgi:thioredoxin reductase